MLRRAVRSLDRELEPGPMLADRGVLRAGAAKL